MIVLVQPHYWFSSGAWEATDPPLGIALIAAVLRRAGHEVAVVEANALRLSLEETVNRVVQLNPGMVGIACNYSPQHNAARALAEALKAHSPDLFIFAGGNHATAMAPLLLGGVGIDVVVRGEAEYSVLSLVEAGGDCSKVPALAWLEDGVYRARELAPAVDLEGLPVPAYDLLPMDLYSRYNLNTARGCPGRCTYCASGVVAKSYRTRSYESLEAEVAFVAREFGPERRFWLSDDTFGAKESNTWHVIELMARHELSWSCLTRVNVIAKARRDALEAMRRSGCHHLSFGIESFNVDQLKLVNKGTTRELTWQALAVAKAHAFPTYGFFMVGLPGETRETWAESRDFIARAKQVGLLDGAVVNIFTPLPGTPLGEELADSGRFCWTDVQWDSLFLRGSLPARYAAELASRWCDLAPDEIEAAATATDF